MKTCCIEMRFKSWKLKISSYLCKCATLTKCLLLLTQFLSFFHVSKVFFSSNFVGSLQILFTSLPTNLLSIIINFLSVLSFQHGEKKKKVLKGILVDNSQILKKADVCIFSRHCGNWGKLRLGKYCTWQKYCEEWKVEEFLIHGAKHCFLIFKRMMKIPNK